MSILKEGRSAKSAFTLVELIVVIAIMGLGLSVFLGLNYRQRESFRWRTSLRELQVFFKLARSYAVLERRPDVCSYDPAGRIFRESLRQRRVVLPAGVELVLSEEEKSRLAAAEAEAADKTAGDQKTDAQPVALKQVTFYGDGGAGGGPVRLRSGRYRARLEIDPLTGVVRVVQETADDENS